MNKRYLDFKKLWQSEIKRKFLRSSKEAGVYPIIKKILSPNKQIYSDDLIYYLYVDVLKELIGCENRIIDYTNEGRLSVKRKYSVDTAVNSPRHLSQIFVFSILRLSNITDDKFKKIFEEMDKKIFEGCQIKSFFKEKKGIIKLFFKN